MISTCTEPGHSVLRQADHVRGAPGPQVRGRLGSPALGQRSAHPAGWLPPVMLHNTVAWLSCFQCWQVGLW